jgi:HEPN domain-containing protein
MPQTDDRAELTREWLRKAAGDLKAADLHDLAAFHCQQAFEKALKGYLTWHDRPFRKTHDLVELIEQCIEFVRDRLPDEVHPHAS